MRASRGMGAIAPSKMPTAQTKARRDNTNFETFAKGKWIQEAVKKPGSLRAALGVKEGQTIPAKALAKAAKAPGKMGQRARLAETLKGLK